MVDVSPSNESWLSVFFSGRNTLHWEEIGSQNIPEVWSSEVSQWIKLIEDRGERVPICLPCVADDGSVQWYAGARTLPGAHALADELHAFVGPSFGHFDGLPHRLRNEDAQEAALTSVCVGSVYRLEGRNEKEISDLLRAFSLFRGLLEKRQVTTTATTRPFGVVRGQFDRALSAGNELEAQSLLDEMRRAGRLTSENLKFLEVRLMAGLGNWGKIVLESSLLRDLTDFPLPPRVVRDVSEAFFHFYVEPFDKEGGLDSCLEKLKSSSLMQLDRLFSQRHNIQHSAVIKVFLLRELLRDTVDPVYSESLLAELGDKRATTLTGEISAYLTARRREPSPTSDGLSLLEKANAAFDDDDYDRALTLYLRAPVGDSSIRRMISCARFAADEDSARKVLNYVENFSNDAISRVDEQTQSALEALRKQAQSPTVVGLSSSGDPGKVDDVLDWLTWARWVAEGATRQDALDLLNEKSGIWSAETICRRPESVDEFANILVNAAGDREDIFRAAFDEIFSAFIVDNDEPIAATKPLHQNLLFLLATSPSRSSSDLSVSTQLAARLLSLGLTTDEYVELVERLTELVESDGAVSSLDWALDLTELLVLERCQDIEARLRFFTSISSFAQQYAHRITTSQRYTLEVLYEDFGIVLPESLRVSQDASDKTNDENIVERLAGTRIGIYTLTESAGQRAKQVLLEIAPDCQVDLNKDHDCTERLAALAKSADIFVFAWKSSKHQAFYCVKDNRPDELPLLQPLGKGSTSIIREVLEHVQYQGGSADLAH